MEEFARHRLLNATKGKGVSKHHNDSNMDGKKLGLCGREKGRDNHCDTRECLSSSSYKRITLLSVDCAADKQFPRLGHIGRIDV